MQADQRETDADIAKRGIEFLQWLSKRPETEIAVVGFPTGILGLFAMRRCCCTPTTALLKPSVLLTNRTIGREGLVPLPIVLSV